MMSWIEPNLNEISMMTGSKVRLTNGYLLILTTDYNNIGIKVKDIERQIKQKRNHPFKKRFLDF